MKAARVIGLLLAVAAVMLLAGAAFAGKASKPAHARHAPRAGVVQKERSSEESATENGSEQETGQSGEPAQGHEDPAGQDVNHECIGNCQE